MSQAKTKSDWVSSRLDEIHNEAFRSYQSSASGEALKRKASFGMLDNKLETAHKHKLYRLFDATYDTIWLRFVFISQSKFPNAAGPAQADLLQLSAIALEVRTGLFDLLALRARIRVAIKGAASLAGVQAQVEHDVRAAQELHGLTTMQQRVSDMISEVKFKLIGQREAASSNGAASPVRKVASSPLGGIGPATMDLGADGECDTTPLPTLVEAPIVLLEERLKHFSAADRDALLVAVPPLRDLRSSLMILYALRCDDAAVALALGDTLGDCYWRVLQSAVLRDDFAAPLLAAFQSARAGTWMFLRDLHALDLAATARATNVVVNQQQGHSKRFGSEGGAALAAAGASAAGAAGAASPAKVSYGSASSESSSAAPATEAAPAVASSPTVTASSPQAQQQQQPQQASNQEPQMSASPALAARALPPIPGALSVAVSGETTATGAAAAASTAANPGASSASSPVAAASGTPAADPSSPTGSTGAVVPIAESGAGPSSSDATTGAAAASGDDLASPPPPPVQEEPGCIISAAGDRWMEAKSGDHTYYFNTRTRASTWTKPVPAAETATRAAPAAALAPLQEGNEE